MRKTEVPVDLNHEDRRIQRARMRRILKRVSKWGSVDGPPPPRIFKRKPTQ